MATITKLEKYNGQSWIPYDLGVTVNHVELVSSIDKNLGCSSLDEWTKLIGNNFKLDSGASTATMVVKNINTFDTNEKQQIEVGDTFDTVIGALNVALGSALNTVSVQSIATTHNSEAVKVGDTIDNIAGKINYIKYNPIKILNCFTSTATNALLTIEKGKVNTQYWKNLYSSSGGQLKAVFDIEKNNFYVWGNKNSDGKYCRSQKILTFFRVLPYKYTAGTDNTNITNYNYVNIYRVGIDEYSNATSAYGLGVSARNFNISNEAKTRVRLTSLVVDTNDTSEIVRSSN